MNRGSVVFRELECNNIMQPCSSNGTPLRNMPWISVKLVSLGIHRESGATHVCSRRDDSCSE